MLFKKLQTNSKYVIWPKKNQYIDKYTFLNFVREDQYMAHLKLMLKQFCELCIEIITD